MECTKAGEERSGFWEMKRAATPAMNGDWEEKRREEVEVVSVEVVRVNALGEEAHGFRGSRVDDVGVSDSSGEDGASRSGERDGEAEKRREQFSWDFSTTTKEARNPHLLSHFGP